MTGKILTAIYFAKGAFSNPEFKEAFASLGLSEDEFVDQMATKWAPAIDREWFNALIAQDCTGLNYHYEIVVPLGEFFIYYILDGTPKKDPFEEVAQRFIKNALAKTT